MTQSGRRALFLADVFPPAPGGGARSLAALLARFPAGAAVVSTPHRAGCGSVDRSLPVPVRRARTLVGPQGFGLRLWRAQIGWEIRRADPGVLVICGTGVEATLGLEIHEARGVPFVLLADAPEIAALRSSAEGGDARARSLVDRAGAIVVPSRTAWLEAYKLHTRPHDLEEIAPAVDLMRFRPGPLDAGRRAKLQAGRGPVLLAVADDDPALDVETLFQAFAAVRAQQRKAVLVAVGFRESENRSLAKSLKIDRGLRFLDATAEDLPALYRAADLYLVAHRGERGAPIQRSGTAIAEAMASGLAIAATRTSATTDVIDEDDGAVLVEPGAHAKLGKAAADLLRSDERRRELGAAARERAEERHDAGRCAERLHTLLEVLVVRRLRREPLAASESRASAA